MQPIDRAFLLRAINEATTSVFEMMLGLEVSAEETGPGTEKIKEDVLSLVSLTGPWRGTGTLSCSMGAASRLAAKFLMADEVDEEGTLSEDTLDAFGELGNMVIGNIKQTVESEVGPMGISIPTVICGGDFQYKSLTGTSAIEVHFHFGTHVMEVQLNLVPAPEVSSHRQSRALHPVSV